MLNLNLSWMLYIYASLAVASGIRCSFKNRFWLFCVFVQFVCFILIMPCPDVKRTNEMNFSYYGFETHMKLYYIDCRKSQCDSETGQKFAALCLALLTSFSWGQCFESRLGDVLHWQVVLVFLFLSREMFL